jgi:small membrane protein
MIIRILLLFGLGAIGWFIFLRRNRLPFHIMTVFGLIAAGAVAVVFPETTQDAANLVGVGRGADLITYIAIVAVMFVLLHYYTKFVDLQRQVTEVTRELAILRAEVDRIAPPAKPPAPEPEPEPEAPREPTAETVRVLSPRSRS